MRGHSCRYLLSCAAIRGRYASDALPAGKSRGAEFAEETTPVRSLPRPTRNGKPQRGGRRSDDTSGDRQIATWTRDQPAAERWARRSGGWFRKEGTVGPFLAWRSFGTFLPPRAERYINSAREQENAGDRPCLHGGRPYEGKRRREKYTSTTRKQENGGGTQGPALRGTSEP